MRWLLGLPLVLFAAVVFMVVSPAAGEVVNVDLNIGSSNPADNTMNLSVRVQAFGYDKTDSDTSGVTGNMLTRLQAEFSPTTNELTSLSGIEFYGGSFELTEEINLYYEFKALFATVATITGTGTGIGGTFDTIPAMGSISESSGAYHFNAEEHEAIINQGSLSVVGTGLASAANQSIVMTPADPIKGTTPGTGDISISKYSTSGNVVTYKVDMKLPLSINQPIDTTDFPIEADIDVAASGTFVTSGYFSRTIPVNPIAVNDPMSGNEGYYSVLEDNQLTIDVGQGVLVNDTDPNGDSLSAIKASDPAHGSVALNSNGSLVYTPDANWYGTDTFTYKAFDGTNYSENAATVEVTVDPVLDVPDITIDHIDHGSVGDGLHAYTLRATGIGITSLGEFTIDGQVHQVWNTTVVDDDDPYTEDPVIVTQTEWLGDGSATTTEVTDSYVIFGNERIPDQPGVDVVVTEETIDEFDSGSTDTGMGTLNNYSDGTPSHDIYLKTGTPSSDSETVDLMYLVIPEGQTVDVDFTLLASMYHGLVGDGISDVSSQDFEYTLEAFVPGDATMDNMVNSDDLAILGAKWGMTSGAEWGDADFNGDGAVDSDDLAYLGANWGYDGTTTGASAVPEPSTIAMLILGALCLVGYRTRK